MKRMDVIDRVCEGDEAYRKLFDKDQALAQEISELKKEYNRSRDFHKRRLASIKRLNKERVVFGKRIANYGFKLLSLKRQKRANKFAMAHRRTKLVELKEQEIKELLNDNGGQ